MLNQIKYQSRSAAVVAGCSGHRASHTLVSPSFSPPLPQARSQALLSPSPCQPGLPFHLRVSLFLSHTLRGGVGREISFQPGAALLHHPTFWHPSWTALPQHPVPSRGRTLLQGGPQPASGRWGRSSSRPFTACPPSDASILSSSGCLLHNHPSETPSGDDRIHRQDLGQGLVLSQQDGEALTLQLRSPRWGHWLPGEHPPSPETTRRHDGEMRRRCLHCAADGGDQMVLDL